MRNVELVWRASGSSIVKSNDLAASLTISRWTTSAGRMRSGLIGNIPSSLHTAQQENKSKTRKESKGAESISDKTRTLMS